MGFTPPYSFENPCSIWLRAQKALRYFLLRLTFLFDNQGRNKIQQQSSERIIRCCTLPELWSHVYTPQASSEIFQASLSSLPVPLEYIYWWVREFQLYGKIKTKQLFFFVLRINHECPAIDTRVKAVIAQKVSYHNSNILKKKKSLPSLVAKQLQSEYVLWYFIV